MRRRLANWLLGLGYRAARKVGGASWSPPASLRERQLRRRLKNERVLSDVLLRQKRRLEELEEYVTGKQLAERFNVTDRTIRRWRWEGMPSVKRERSARRYPLHACEKWITAQSD